LHQALLLGALLYLVTIAALALAERVFGLVVPG